MNILIIGEFSAFAKHLKNGLKLLGHQVVVVNSGDDWKRIAGDSDDVDFNIRGLTILGRHIKGSERMLAPWTNWRLEKKLRKRLKGIHIDIVVVIGHVFLSNNLFTIGVKVSLVKGLIEKGAKMIQTICYGCPAFQYAYPEFERLSMQHHPLKEPRFSFLIKNADAIIPTTYSYYYAITSYCNHFGFSDAKITRAIPLPITVDKDVIIRPCQDRKIVIFHGISRPVLKGTGFIKNAMDRIQREYPNSVECICEERLPYNDYIKLFDRIDILIDQVYFSGWGVNAAIGAMKGKCVLAPCGKDNGDNMQIPDIPFVQIEPDSDQIYAVLKNLVENPMEIDRNKRASRCFIEKYCESSVVGRRYIDAVFNDNKAGLD